MDPHAYLQPFLRDFMGFGHERSCCCLPPYTSIPSICVSSPYDQPSDIFFKGSFVTMAIFNRKAKSNAVDEPTQKEKVKFSKRPASQ